MENILVAQLSQLTHLSKSETFDVEQSFPIKTVPKGTFLLKEGHIAQDSYLVINGCVRKYYISDGEEITSDFFTEGQPAAEFNSLSNQKPSKYYFVCVEETTIAVINAKKEAALYKKYPRFEAICRVEFEKMMGQKSDQIESFINSRPEEKYRQLLQERPDLLNRVPQYQIASYLGVKPETLSRIRKRITAK